MSAERQEYEDGYGEGKADREDGEAKWFATTESEHFIDGYLDGYEGRRELPPR